MKTIREWLESIEDDTIREAAIRNAEKHNTKILREKWPSLHTAILGAFVWEKTLEGHYYWRQINQQAAAGTLKTKEQ